MISIEQEERIMEDSGDNYKYDMDIVHEFKLGIHRELEG